MMINLFLNLHLLHAIYIGFVQITPINDTGSFALEIRVFQDDFQDALRNLAGKTVLIKPDRPTPNLEHWISTYFNQHIELMIDREATQFTFQSIEAVNEVYILKFQFENNSKWQTLSLKADFLMELYPQQSNVVKLVHQEQTYHFRLTAKKTQMNKAF